MLEPYKNDVREMSYHLFQEYLIKGDIRELKKPLCADSYGTIHIVKGHTA